MPKKKKLTIEELEAILNTEEECPIEILPNGEIRASKPNRKYPKGVQKPITMRESLGGEYGIAA